MIPDWKIRQLGIIEPFAEKTKYRGVSHGLSSYGYDLRVDDPFAGRGKTIPLGHKSFTLVSTYEYVRMPNNVVGFIYDKSTWARQGLQCFNTVIEPGWEGQITLELKANRTLSLPVYAGIVQIMFVECDPCEAPYEGKYQGQTGVTEARYD